MIAKNNIVRYSLISWTFFLIAFFSTSSLWAATYHVAQNVAGVNTGVDCANAKSLSWFNSNASAGDTAILCDGTFTTRILPSDSGSDGSPITYQSQYEYNGSGNQYGVVVTNSSYGADLTKKSYITIDGLYFNDCGKEWVYMSNADYCIVQNSKFYKSRTWGGITLKSGSKYNKFLDNTFEDAPDSGDANGTWPADNIRNFYDWNSTHNVIEGNIFGRTRHAAIGGYKAQYWVVRNNIIANDYHTGLGAGKYALIEGNLIFNCGINIDLNTEEDVREMFRQPGIQQNYSYTIIRRNVIYNCGGGLSLSSTSTSSDYIANYNRIYNNTIDKAVRNIKGDYNTGETINYNIWKNNAATGTYKYEPDGEDDATPYAMRIRPGYNGTGTGNGMYNNNFYSIEEAQYQWRTTNSTLSNIQNIYSKNFLGATNIRVDPKYTNSANRDFTLQSNSPMIDAGGWLTTITSSTASGVSSIAVADSRYFYDGWGIPREKGDVIKTENGAVTTIKSIDYKAHKISVSPAIDIVKGEGLALNYSGSFPDIGAHEYEDKTDIISPPNGLEIKINQN